MKKYLILASAVLLGFAACGKTDADPENGGGNSPENAHFVRFGIALPSGDPVLYTKADPVHTFREWEVRQLDVYQFDHATQKLEAVHKNVALVNEGPRYGLTLNVADRSARDFLFVANNIAGSPTETILPESVGTLKSTVEQACTRAIASGTEYIATPLLMTASAAGVTPGGNAAQTVTLVRTMARFDIHNYEPTLTLTGVTFRGTYRSAALFGDGFPAAPSTVDFAEKALPAADNSAYGDQTLEPAIVRIDHAATQTTAAFREYKHVIYTHPLPVLAADGPTVVLRGTVATATGPVDWSQTVELKQPTAANPAVYESLRIERNHRYVIRINRVSGGSGALLIAEPWVDGGTVDHTFAPSAPSVSGAGLNGGRIDVAKGGDSYVLQVLSDTEWTVSFRVGAKLSASLDWMTAAGSKSDAQTVLLPDRLTLVCSGNTDGVVRQAFVRVSNKARPSEFTEFEVVQAGS